MTEKRQNVRVIVLLNVLCESASGKHEGRTGDISLGGCFIDTTGRVTVGETIGFKLQLPTGEWIELQGEVRWELPQSGFGVKFKDLSDECQKQVATLVAAQRVTPSGPPLGKPQTKEEESHTKSDE
jgi:hypothetical protein